MSYYYYYHYYYHSTCYHYFMTLILLSVSPARPGAASLAAAGRRWPTPGAPQREKARRGPILFLSCSYPFPIPFLSFSYPCSYPVLLFEEGQEELTLEELKRVLAQHSAAVLAEIRWMLEGGGLYISLSLCLYTYIHIYVYTYMSLSIYVYIYIHIYILCVYILYMRRLPHAAGAAAGGAADARACFFVVSKQSNI